MSNKPMSNEECDSCFKKIATGSSDRLSLEDKFAELRKYDIPWMVKEVLNQSILAR